jgi:hypothetical protein
MFIQQDHISLYNAMICRISNEFAHRKIAEIRAGSACVGAVFRREIRALAGVSAPTRTARRKC